MINMCSCFVFVFGVRRLALLVGDVVDGYLLVVARLIQQSIDLIETRFTFVSVSANGTLTARVAVSLRACLVGLRFSPPIAIRTCELLLEKATESIHSQGKRETNKLRASRTAQTLRT